MRDRQINAFATLGGYVATNAGLVLAATREDQVASVLAHEITHVTQDHVLRGVERAQRDSVPILLAMLGAIMVAQQAGGNSADDASLAAISAGQALMYQRQIDYTRDNESAERGERVDLPVLHQEEREGMRGLVAVRSKAMADVLDPVLEQRILQRVAVMAQLAEHHRAVGFLLFRTQHLAGGGADVGQLAGAVLRGDGQADGAGQHGGGEGNDEGAESHVHQLTPWNCDVMHG